MLRFPQPGFLEYRWPILWPGLGATASPEACSRFGLAAGNETILRCLLGFSQWTGSVRQRTRTRSPAVLRGAGERRDHKADSSGRLGFLGALGGVARGIGMGA